MVITFSRYYPKGHPRAGEPTFFPEMILNSLGVSIGEVSDEFKPYLNDFAMLEGSAKHHTIRAGNRWKVGDKFTPRVWGDDINPKSERSGPYQSKQVTFGPEIEVKKIWSFGITEWEYFINGFIQDTNSLSEIAKNDGLNINDFEAWFACGTKKKNYPMKFQIICWNENIEYT